MNVPWVSRLVGRSFPHRAAAWASLAVVAVLAACSGSGTSVPGAQQRDSTNPLQIVSKSVTQGPVSVNAGGVTAGSFLADTDYTGGDTNFTGAPIDVSRVSSPAPQAVYQTERWGKTFQYVVAGLKAGSTYAVRLHFAEIHFTAAGQRIFNVAINGQSILSNFDIVAATGGENRAIAVDANVIADTTGAVTIAFTSVKDYAKISGFEIAAPTGVSTKIKHVVVIIQENRSVDNLFNGFPGADTVQSGLNSKGQTVPLAPVTLEDGHDPNHFHTSFEVAYDGGKNDGFDKEGYNFYPTSTPNYQYAYVPPSETAPYFALGEKFALGDRMFESNSGPSYVSHQYLIAGQSANVAEVPSMMPWGCDAPAGTTTTVLNSKGSEVAGPFPCFDYSTLGDLMDAKGVTWAYYAPALSQPGFIWSAYDAIKHIRYGKDWTSDVISPETTILSDIQNNNLRQVSYVTPDYLNSDHAFAKSNTGPAWVSSIVDAVGNSQYWADTTVVVLWDDWGGWYDHVVPQQLDVNGLGFRTPVLVISPYVKSGYVSHVQHEHASIVHFIETVFNLGTLGQADLRADDMRDFFNLDQKPLAFPTTHSSVQRRNMMDFFLREKPSLKAPDND